VVNILLYKHICAFGWYIEKEVFPIVHACKTLTGWRTVGS